MCGGAYDAFRRATEFAKRSSNKKKEIVAQTYRVKVRMSDNTLLERAWNVSGNEKTQKVGYGRPCSYMLDIWIERLEEEFTGSRSVKVVAATVIDRKGMPLVEFPFPLKKPNRL